MKIIVSIKKDISIAVNTIFLLLYFLDDISTFKAFGKLNPAILLRSKRVGIIIEYKPIPVVPIILVNTILVNSPITFVKNPPITRIIVDFINIFFIVQVYYFFNKLLKKHLKNIKYHI